MRAHPTVVTVPSYCDRSFPREDDIEQQVVFCNTKKALRPNVHSWQRWFVKSTLSERSYSNFRVRFIELDFDRTPYERSNVSHLPAWRSFNYPREYACKYCF